MLSIERAYNEQRLVANARNQWPDYCQLNTLAKRLNLPAGAIEQLVKRGLLPAPIKLGQFKLWRWEDVDALLAARTSYEAVGDPYELGVDRVAQAATARPSR